MLRHAVAQSSRRIQNPCLVARRSYAAATSGQKRALNKQQLQGGTDATPTKPPTPPRPPNETPPPSGPPASGGGDSTPLVMGVALLAAAAGALYYYQSQPGEDAAEVPAKVEALKKEVKEEVKKKKSEEEKKAAEPATVKAEDGSNRVVQIEIPMKEGTRTAPQAPPGSHPEDGNRVTMEVFQSKPTSTVSVKDSLKELQASIDLETSEAMKRANQEVMKSFDESLLEGLDEMSASQLKTRVIQLATEMKERTRWEALRLKEFLAMKEKETADKYLEVLQQQRLEFEGILQRRLLEQEHEMISQTNSKLQEKDSAVKDMIDKAIEKLGEEHENEKKALMDRADQEIKAHYEQMFSQKLEEIKTGTMDELERKVQAIEALSAKLKDLEDALASTKDFHEGSQQAHRLSAAALALAEKMESNKGAGAELNALKAVAGSDNVIASALSSVPSSVAKGVPTLSELQGRFDAVVSKTRQAALVPAGLGGLEGQLAGMLFATLKFPPKPDDPPPEDGSSAAEYILVQAKKHVQYGELDKAVEQLNKLEGQAAFTVEGWKKDAADRIAVEQALKVIKMECALLNESMSESMSKK